MLKALGLTGASPEGMGWGWGVKRKEILLLFEIAAIPHQGEGKKPNWSLWVGRGQ